MSFEPETEPAPGGGILSEPPQIWDGPETLPVGLGSTCRRLTVYLLELFPGCGCCIASLLEPNFIKLEVGAHYSFIAFWLGVPAGWIVYIMFTTYSLRQKNYLSTVFRIRIKICLLDPDLDPGGKKA